MIERILCAAIHYDDGNVHVHQPNGIGSGIIVCGHRHNVCVETYYLLTGKTTEPNNRQGFLTSKNRFVSRYEGYKVALAANQCDESEQHLLMSEDLY